jgi:phosphoribosylanthranilate isomerase
VPDVKICGLTREGDAALAASLGASYLGVVLTESPRRVSAARARAVLDAVPAGAAKRVGVCGAEPIDDVLRAAEEARLDVVQLAAPRSAFEIARLRDGFGGGVWVVVRVRGARLGAEDRERFGHGDGVVLDRWSPAALGGTGEAFDWAAVRDEVAAARGAATLVLAGGLTPATVGGAIATLLPDVVDVSSGVEASPGVKDPARLAAFVAAATAAAEPA